MEEYSVRVNNARRDFMHMDGNLWDNIERLWNMGYSLRVISEITGITRSKLQRKLSESNKGRNDDVRTQNRDFRVVKTKELLNMGMDKDDIAREMGMNTRTIEGYIRQLKDRGEL